jgi:hypothetical protein
MHVPDVRKLFEQPEQERGRDVVGQIAYDPEPAAVVQRREIELQHVRLVQAQGRVAASDCLEMLDRIAIDFDRMQLAQPRKQRQGDRAEPGPDFHDRVVRLRIDGVDDAPDDLRIVQEVLAEALTGSVHEMRGR